jgi:hypothetical protein
MAGIEEKKTAAAKAMKIGGANPGGEIYSKGTVSTSERLQVSSSVSKISV